MKKAKKVQIKWRIKLIQKICILKEILMQKIWKLNYSWKKY